MKRLIILVLLPLSLFAQNTIGFPDILNYSKHTYLGGLQNWDIKQDKNGTIYIANNDGVLTFDGKYWKLYPLPNKMIVRSIEITPNGRIYVGGQDELGYFTPSENGQFIFKSITNLIPEKHRHFGDIWDIIANGDNVFFRSTKKIFKLYNDNFSVYTTAYEWSFLGVCNGKMFAHEYQKGLLCFENNVWKPIFEKNVLPLNSPITGITAISKDSSYITTLKYGIFIKSTTGITKLSSVNNSIFENQRIYCATLVSNDLIALGTSNSGVIVIDKKGDIIQHFSKVEGLQNNNVLCIFLDHQKNLWLGLDNGIDLISYNSAIKQINPFFLDAAGYAALFHNNTLYLGTANSLYAVPIQKMKDFSFCKSSFNFVNNTKGQIWGLSEVNNQVLLGHHEGAFVVNGYTSSPISNTPGFWNFTPSSNSFPSQQMIAGNYSGISIFNYQNNHFTEAGNIQGFDESSRFVAIDADDNFWVSHPYLGVYKMVSKGGLQFEKHLYTAKNGLPSTLNNYVYKIKNEVVIATEKGVYKYNAEKDNFQPSEYYDKILGKQSIRYLKEDSAGNIWFIHEKKLSVIDYATGKPVIIPIPELNDKLLSGFYFVYPINQNNIILGGEKGFYIIDYEKYKLTSSIPHVQIRNVKIIDNQDSVLFGGYFNDINEKQIQVLEHMPTVKYGWKALHFEFSTALFGYQPGLEYSYRLKGFDNNWCNWTKQTEKEYTNIPSGNYTFEVKARNNLSGDSEIASYSFRILPPWYLNIWAKILYIFFIIFIGYRFYKHQQKKFKLQHEIHLKEQQKIIYVHELELNKTENEIISLKNEKLEIELDYKNSELASSAMHLVKKGELISKVKSEINRIMREYNNPRAVEELRKLIKSLTEDENIDKEWVAFSKHYDKVHNNFLVELKLKHPTITPSELKLAAYLNMNLSTKEIAQLMNISVRGVEISRYRLRKRLGISTEVTLFDYLITIGKKD